MTYIKIFKDIVGAVGLLSDEEAGRLFKGLLCYANGNETDLPGQEKLIFAMLKIQLDRDKAAYGSYIEKQRANGAKGGRPRKSQAKPVKEKKSADSTEPPAPCNNEPKPEEKAPETAQRAEADPPVTPAEQAAVEEVKNAWNTLPEIVPKVQNIVPGTDRYRKLQHCIKTLGEQQVINAVNGVKESAFLQGQNRKNWVITFDWFICPDNIQKVLDGNYKNAAPGNGSAYNGYSGGSTGGYTGGYTSGSTYSRPPSYDVLAAMEKSRREVPKLTKRR